jgi:hypothetical protein
MAANWGKIAGQLGSLGFTNLAKEAVNRGAESEERRREDIRRQLEQERLLAEARRLEQERLLAEARRSAQQPAAKVTMSELRRQLKGLSPEELEAAWRLLVPALMDRVRRGEVSPERATALREIVDDFDRARALPDVEDRTVEMNRVMARLNAIFTPERRS